MKRVGIQGRLKTLINRMFKGNVLLIRDPVTGSTGVVRPERGVAQGDPLSPLLFNLVMDMIVEESGILSSEGGWVLMDGPGRRDRRAEVGLSGDLGGTRITHLIYADDMVLLTESSGRLQTDLLKLEEATGNHGLTINAKKSSVLHMGEDGRIAPPDRALRMGDGSAIPALGDQDITRYLGVSLVGVAQKQTVGLPAAKNWMRPSPTLQAPG